MPTFTKKSRPLAASLLAAVFFLFPLSAVADTPHLIYNLKLSALHPDTLSSLQIGAPLVDNIGKYAIGTLEDIAVAPHMKETYNGEDDALISAPHPFLVDVLLTVRAEGERDAGAVYLIDGYRLSLGKFVSFTTPFFAGSGECVLITAASPTPVLPKSEVPVS